MSLSDGKYRPLPLPILKFKINKLITIMNNNNSLRVGVKDSIKFSMKTVDQLLFWKIIGSFDKIL